MCVTGMYWPVRWCIYNRIVYRVMQWYEYAEPQTNPCSPVWQFECHGSPCQIGYLLIFVQTGYIIFYLANKILFKMAISISKY